MTLAQGTTMTREGLQRRGLLGNPPILKGGEEAAQMNPISVEKEKHTTLTYCDEQHYAYATEFHVNGELCGPWLENLERGNLTVEQRNAIFQRCRLDSLLTMSKMIDGGQLVRLVVSLSLAYDSRPRRSSWKFWGKEPFSGSGFGFEKMEQIDQLEGNEEK